MWAFFIVILVVWSCGGCIWGIIYDVKTYDISKYHPLTIFIGGPIWWIYHLTNINDKKIREKFKPRKRKKYVDT